MFKASVIKVDTKGVGAKISKIENNESLGLFAAEEAARLMNPFVPKLSGFLRASRSYKPWAVTYSTPYARRQYYGKDYKHSEPGTTAEWDKNISGARKASLARAITAKAKTL